MAVLLGNEVSEDQWFLGGLSGTAAMRVLGSILPFKSLKALTHLLLDVL